MNKNEKKKMQSILSRVNKAWPLPYLPSSVAVFHNHPLVKIVRVLGGVSILLVLGKFKLAQTLFYVVFPLAAIQFTYIILINAIKFIYLIYL